MISVDLSRLITAQDRAAEAEADRRDAERIQSRAFLARTDWYVTRLTETGTPVPPDVSAEREAARRVLDQSAG